MQWRGQRQSDNIEDAGSGGGGRLVAGGGIGTLILALAVYFLGGDPSQVLNSPPSPQRAPQTQNQQAQLNTDERKFVATVLADTEDTWSELFRRYGRRYQNPKLVLFQGAVRSACGVAGSSTGPFYCPNDQKLYLDLAFFRDLNSRYGAPGDFAQAYVIAHEIGHHVQNQLGTMNKVQSLQQRTDKTTANQLSVRLELQADYYAGVWAHYAQKRNLLDAGDVEEGINAAAAVGDDKLQEQAQGYVVPDSFTHGTAKQRATWFYRGLKSGDIEGGQALFQ